MQWENALLSVNYCNAICFSLLKKRKKKKIQSQNTASKLWIP